MLSLYNLFCTYLLYLLKQYSLSISVIAESFLFTLKFLTRMILYFVFDLDCTTKTAALQLFNTSSMHFIYLYLII